MRDPEALMAFCASSPPPAHVATQRNDERQQVKTLAHELGHAILHEDSDDERSLKELEAESVAYIVCSELGIDSDDCSFGSERRIRVEARVVLTRCALRATGLTQFPNERWINDFERRYLDFGRSE
jgi:Zn-dependent peptidase ImmA (M78 family)